MFAYLRNLLGFNVDGGDLFVVKYPIVELTLHVTARLTQLGSLVGLVIAPAIVHWKFGPSANLKHKRESAKLLFRWLLIPPIGGAAVAPAINLVWCLSWKKYFQQELTDRARLLRFNSGQLWMDRAFCATLVAVVVSDVLRKRRAAIRAIVAGNIFAIAVLTLYLGETYPGFSKQNRPLELIDYVEDELEEEEEEEMDEHVTGRRSAASLADWYNLRSAKGKAV